MKTEENQLPKEIQDYHELKAKIAELKLQEMHLSEVVVEKYCPYKNGQKVEYTLWWDRLKTRHGKIAKIKFNGISSEAIDNKWVIEITPLTKDFKEIGRKRNSDFVGKGDRDKIKAIS